MIGTLAPQWASVRASRASERWPESCAQDKQNRQHIFKECRLCSPDILVVLTDGPVVWVGTGLKRESGLP